MNLANKISSWFSPRQSLAYLLLFVISLALFSYLHFDYTFADPDSFYHAKMAEILADQGAITELPWLSATNLKYSFVDHHFAYHLILIPFVKTFPPLLGLKIATIIFASLLMVTIFWFLGRLQVKGAFWYALFLLTINPFIFRINLAKAQALVIILLFLVIYFLFNRRYLSLILASAFYVWLYGGWPIILVLVLIYGLLSWVWAFKASGWWLARLGKLKVWKQNFLLLFSAGLGIAAGIFFSPYFIKNVQFYYQQSFKIALINYQYLIDVGGEWYPYQLPDLLAAAIPTFILAGLALLVFIASNKKQPLAAWFFLILSFLFFALTLKSRRYVEYFMPLVVVFSALSLSQGWELVRDKFPKSISRGVILPGLIVGVLVLSPIFYRDLKSIKDSYAQGFAFDKFAAASNWLEQNSNPGDIVFHTDWDEFPILFYHNHHNYYLVGLDPTFMYQYDKDLYQRWVEITRGESADNLYLTIKTLFDAKYVFVDISQSASFDRNLANNFYFQKVFEDSESKIYRLIE